MSFSSAEQIGFHQESAIITAPNAGRLTDQRMTLAGLFYAAYCLNMTAYVPFFRTMVGKSLAAVDNGALLPLSSKFQVEDIQRMIKSHNIKAEFGYIGDERSEDVKYFSHSKLISCDNLRKYKYAPRKTYRFHALYIVPNPEHQQLYREILLSMTPNFIIDKIARSVINKLPTNYNCIHDRSERDRLEAGGTKIDFVAPDNMTYVASGNDHSSGLQYRKIFDLQFDPDTHALIDQLVCINAFKFFADPRSGFSSYIIYRRFEKGLQNQTYLLSTRKLVQYEDVPYIYSFKNGYTSNPGF